MIKPSDANMGSVVKIVESVLSWVHSFGIGGAFFVITLGTLAVCGLALWVVLAALKGDRP